MVLEVSGHSYLEPLFWAVMRKTIMVESVGIAGQPTLWWLGSRE